MVCGGAGCRAAPLTRGRSGLARLVQWDNGGCPSARPSFFYGRPVRRVASATLSVVCFSAIDICTIILGLVPSTRAWRYSRTLMVGHCVHRLSTASCPFCKVRFTSCPVCTAKLRTVLADVKTGELVGDQPPQNRDGVRAAAEPSSRGAVQRTNPHFHRRKIRTCSCDIDLCG